ncbi:helix-turn-helix domain-containing protein [Ruminococcus sp.]
MNALATVKYHDESGKEHAYVDEDIKIRIQMKLVKSIPKWRGLKK